MVGGISGNYPVPVPARRTPEQQSEGPAAVRFPRDPSPAVSRETGAPRTLQGQFEERNPRSQVEARFGGNGVMLSPDPSARLPRFAHQALAVYQSVAATPIADEGVLVGLDMRV